jgi:hypothetical protein
MAFGLRRPGCLGSETRRGTRPTRDHRECGRTRAIQTDFSGGIVRDNPEVNKRVAEMTALGRAGVPDDIGPMSASGTSSVVSTYS